MALASFGKPRYVAEFREIVRLGENGQYTIEPLRLEERFGPARQRGGPLEPRHFDIAHSLQVVLEETVLELSRLAAPGLRVRRPLHGGRRRAELRDERQGARPRPVPAHLGPARGRGRRHRPGCGGLDRRPGARRRLAARTRWTTPTSGRASATTRSRRSCGGRSFPIAGSTTSPSQTAEILARDEVIGWFQGRMEFGPRALGRARSSPRRSTPRCRQGSTRSRIGRTSGRSPRWSWRRRRPSGSSAPASRRSCSSSTTCGPRRPTASPPCGTPTARPASRRSTGPSTRSTTT